VKPARYLVPAATALLILAMLVTAIQSYVVYLQLRDIRIRLETMTRPVPHFRIRGKSHKGEYPDHASLYFTGTYELTSKLPTSEIVFLYRFDRDDPWQHVVMTPSDPITFSATVPVQENATIWITKAEKIDGEIVGIQDWEREVFITGSMLERWWLLWP